MKDHKLVPLRPPESILAVVRKAYGNATAYDVGHVWHEIYTRLPDAAPVQEPVAYLMKHGQWSTNIETDEGMWLLEQFPSEDVQIPVYLAAQPRKAVKLRDEEVEALFLAHAGYGGTDFWSVSRAIEAAVREKLGATE